VVVERLVKLSKISHLMLSTLTVVLGVVQDEQAKTVEQRCVRALETCVLIFCACLRVCLPGCVAA